MAKEHPTKQVYDLSAQDFLEHPIWEFCADEENVEGQDEATVKPSQETEIPGYSPGAYVVAADVTYANGQSAKGYMYSGQPDDFGCLQPNVLLAAGQVNLWLGALRFLPDADQTIAASVKMLGGTGMFPMSFETRANVNGAPLKVVAQGLLGCEIDGQVVQVG